jgi:ornithine--oxo-acid transaminase
MYSRLLKLDKLYGAQNYKSLQVILRQGKGVHVTDIEGKEYYDFLSSYSSVNQGHCHPRLVKVMKDQCEKLTLCSRAFYNENLCNFFEYMHKKFGYDKSLPMNTGVEASETAVKLARLWGYKTKEIPQDKAEFIVARNNFWGRSIAACSSSSDPSCFTNFGPFVPGFHFVDFNNLQELEYVLKTRPNVVGFMVEPIQGEAGIQIPDDDYLVKAKMLCEKYNCLLICDEVQTGIGRTGKMLASHTIKPDMVVLGKALSGGMMPVSCVLGDNKVMDLVDPGTHGSTYGGNPLGTAIVPHAVDIIESEGLLENAEKRGKQFRDELKIFVDLGTLKDVRGKGLLNAIELHNEESANELVDKMMSRGLLTKVTREGTIRMCPPLVISDMEMDNSLNIIRRCLTEL